MLTFNKEQYTRFLQINAIFYYSLNTQKIAKNLKVGFISINIK